MINSHATCSVKGQRKNLALSLCNLSSLLLCVKARLKVNEKADLVGDVEKGAHLELCKPLSVPLSAKLTLIAGGKD